MVVSSISLKPISLHRCLAEGLWIASLDFHFIFFSDFQGFPCFPELVGTLPTGFYLAAKCSTIMHTNQQQFYFKFRNFMVHAT